MKLVTLTCPCCGAQLNVNAEFSKATCPFCNNSFPIDKEVQHLKLDGAAQAGYEFEKGRQRAQAEAQKAAPVYNVPPQQQQKPQRKHGCLWWVGMVLLWFLFLPFVATYYVVRSQKLSRNAKIGIVAAIWIVFLFFAITGSETEESENVNTSSSSAEVTEAEPSEADESSSLNDSSETSESSGLTKDSVVNDFVEAYNAISSSPIETIEPGNIRTKYFTYSYGYSLELLHANDTDSILVTINETNDNAEAGVPGMRDVFHDTVKAIDPSLSDEEVFEYFDNAVNDPAYRGNQTLGSVSVFFSADYDSSNGDHHRGRIEVGAMGGTPDSED